MVKANLKRFFSGGWLGLAAMVLAGCTMVVSTERPASPAVPTATLVAVAQVTETLTATATDTLEPPTATPEPPTATATVEPTVEPPTATPPPADTPTPEPSPTPEPPSATATPTTPYLTVASDVNLRAGPDAGYAWVGMLTAGQTAEIVGRNADGSWWQVTHPEGPDGRAWITASFSQAFNTESVPVTAIPDTPTPLPPVEPPTPVPPAIDFVVAGTRLWTNEENGGYSPDGTVNNCGYGHEINVQVVDAGGKPLDGVIIADTYNNPKTITGSHGPGRTQYILYFNGYNLFVEQDPSAGRPVTSEVSPVLSAKDSEIPIPMLIEGHYCANEAICLERISKNSLCQGHYTWDIVFQRTW